FLALACPFCNGLERRSGPICSPVRLVYSRNLAFISIRLSALRGNSMARHAFLLMGVALLLAAPAALAEELPPLRTAVDGTFAPHAFPSLSGGYEGFNIDLANEIARRLKRKIVIDAAQFSGLVPALQAGTYDFLSAPTTVTKERAENMLFTEG